MINILLFVSTVNANETYKSFSPNESTHIEQELSDEDKACIKEQVEQFKEIKPYLLETEKPIPVEEPLLESLKTIQPEIKPELQPKTHSHLQIFISFSMPVESLKAWSRQAKMVNGTLVLRGFVENSLKKTLQKVLQVFGQDNLPLITVDPVAFQQFGIKVVPAVVVAPVSNAKQTLFDVAYGDVSLSAALQRMIEDGENPALAQAYLNLLQGNHE